MFDTLSDRLSAAFRNLRGKTRLTDADIDATAREIRLALLEADVNLNVVKEFIGNVRERAKGAEIHAALNPAQQIVKIVDEELVSILGGEARPLRFAKRPPTVIMLAGLQGSGNTTLAGKLGKWLKDQGHSPLLVAADLQRPNAVNQLQVVGERAGVHVFAPEPGNGVGDPVSVARNSILQAMSKLYDVVIVDTAGRLGVDAELMQQAADIRDAVSPTEILFVVDAMIGQDAVNTAQAFADGVGFDGVVLSKLDGDARGGAALSVRQVTGAPIYFAGMGEKMDALEPFHPERVAQRILGMGDVMGLIEKTQQAYDEKKAKTMAKKLKKAEFTLEDFRDQMAMLRKMGDMKSLMGMIPGMSQAMKKMGPGGPDPDKELRRIEAMICSMTPGERNNPDIIDGSRRKRIAAGSGTSVSELNQFLKRFRDAKKMMKRLAKMGPGGLKGLMRGMPGF